MIEIYEGKLGGGKTYSAVERIIAALIQGATVATNIALCWPEIKDFCRRRHSLELDDKQLIEIKENDIEFFHKATPSNCLVVLDEIHLWFNARDWANTNRQLLSFLTQSRKYETDIILISQSAENIDKQFRRLAQFIWRFRDLERWTIPVLGVKWPLKQILQVQFDYDGKTIMQRRFRLKSKEIFKCYDTKAVHQAKFDRLEVLDRGKPKKIKRRYSVKLATIVAVMLACICFVTYRLWSKPLIPQSPGPSAGAQKVLPSPAFPVSQPALPVVAERPVPEKVSIPKVIPLEMAYFEDGRERLFAEGQWWTLGAQTPYGRIVGISEHTVQIMDGEKLHRIDLVSNWD